MIGDGGNDMFDGGNYLSTDLISDFEYTNGQIVSNNVFGESSSYFTKKYPGLFVMTADNT